MSDQLPASRPTAGLRRQSRDELADLVAAARGGECRATRTLVAAVGPAMLRVIRQVMGANYSEAEDLLQEASLNLLDALPRFTGDCTVLHFACRVAVLTAMNARRREAASKRAWRWLKKVEVYDVPAPASHLDTSIDERNAMLAVRQLMTTLPANQAEALALHCVLGCTIDEIASTLSVSRETIRSRLRLAKQSLRQHVEGDSTLTEIMEGVS